MSGDSIFVALLFLAIIIAAEIIDPPKVKLTGKEFQVIASKCDTDQGKMNEFMVSRKKITVICSSGATFTSERK